MTKIGMAKVLTESDVHAVRIIWMVYTIRKLKVIKFPLTHGKMSKHGWKVLLFGFKLWNHIGNEDLGAGMQLKSECLLIFKRFLTQHYNINIGFNLLRFVELYKAYWVRWRATLQNNVIFRYLELADLKKNVNGHCSSPVAYVIV